MSLDRDSPRPVLLEHGGVRRGDRSSSVVQLGAVEWEEHGLQRRIAVEVVERPVHDRIVRQARLSQRRVLDALRSRRVRRDRFLLSEWRWLRRQSIHFLLSARGSRGYSYKDRDN